MQKYFIKYFIKGETWKGSNGIGKTNKQTNKNLRAKMYH